MAPSQPCPASLWMEIWQDFAHSPVHVPAPSPVKPQLIPCLHCASVMISAAHTILQALLGPLGAAHTLQDGNDDLFEYLRPHRQQGPLQTSDQTFLTAQPFPGQKTLKLCASFLSLTCPLSPQVLRMSHDHGPAQKKESDKEYHRQQHRRPPTSF